MKQGKFVPPEIAAVGFDFDWDNQKLWALELPVEEMPIEELTWHFELPFWRNEDGVWFTVKPKEVLADPDTFPLHRDRMAKSDMSYPLHIMWHRDRWVFLDGLHRLAKAVQLGMRRVRVRKVPLEYIPKILAKKEYPVPDGSVRA